jgi:hypothetical protein
VLLTDPAARLALEPLANLARLHIRAGDGDDARSLLDDLDTAVRTRTDTVIDGHDIPASALTRTDNDHHQLVAWLWTVQLADGTRALTRTGRWREALAHLHRHHGVGQRMLDGRQVAVIASIAAGDLDQARQLIATTTPGDPAESAVTASLTAGLDPSTGLARCALDAYRQVAGLPELVTFRTRLGLSILDLTTALSTAERTTILSDLAGQALTSRDGYAARELLSHPACGDLLPASVVADVAGLVRACGLDSGDLSSHLLHDIHDALDIAAEVIDQPAASLSRAS